MTNIVVVPRIKHCPYWLQKPEVDAVQPNNRCCADMHTKPTNRVCRHHVACLNAECPGGTWSNHWAKQLKQMFPNVTSVNRPCSRRKPIPPNITARSNMGHHQRSVSATEHPQGHEDRARHKHQLQLTTLRCHTTNTHHKALQKTNWNLRISWRTLRTAVWCDRTSRIFVDSYRRFRETFQKILFYYEGNVIKFPLKLWYLPNYTFLNPGRQTPVLMATLSDW